jgi:Protein of unknown function (DUF2442)
MDMADSDNIAPDEPEAVWFADERVFVRLHDGRSIGIPLWWYPRLLKASAEDLANYELSPMGVHWPDIDEDISVASMITGSKAPNAIAPMDKVA